MRNLIIPAILESFRSLKDRTIKITFETNEPTPDQMGSVATNINSFGILYFKPNQDQPTKKDEDYINEINVEYDDPARTPSKRLRSVLYLNWKRDPEGFTSAQSHYDHHMEKIINHYKGKLD